uniref:Thyrotropin-releasing hormone receptor n=1 Tax=Ditylenchus dipsaci TaxID=166011 RepID=A0A915CX01_9BILA
MLKINNVKTMVGSVGNLSFAEASLLCPALLSLIKSTPSINSDMLPSTPTTKPVFTTLLNCLGGLNAPTSYPLILILKAMQFRTRPWPFSSTIPKMALPPEVGRQTDRGTEHNSMLAHLNAFNDIEDEDEYWPTHIRLIMSVIFIVLSVVGIVGNILVVVVVKKVPGMITPTNCYLVSLAISDCMFFVAAAPTELSYLHVASSKYIFGGIWLFDVSYLPYLAINTSSMSITAFTVERFIGICYPLRARYICTVKRAKLIIFFIWMFCILYNSPWLYLATLKEDTAHGQQCTFKLTRDNWTYKAISQPST